MEMNEKMFYTDKITHHGFWEFYEGYFSKNKDLKLNILEIGILNGESLKLLKNYFKNSEIYGIDINDIDLKTNGIHTYNISQTNFVKISETFKDIKFDIIIDDGSHITSHQIESFKFLFEYKLTSGGIYIIEDLHTSFRKEYIDTEKTCYEMVENLNDFNFLNDNFNFNPDLFSMCGEYVIFKKNENDNYNSITSLIYKK